MTLLLFDIDGTLLRDASGAHAVALREALTTVHGIDPHASAGDLDAAGRTDNEIARRILRACGIPDAAIDARAGEVIAEACRRYEQLCPADLRDHVVPGMPELLRTLDARDDVRLSLVTGNFEPIARRKLAAAGIGRYFPEGQGGFGSDSEHRAELPGIARRRAGDVAAAETVVIGDTPKDIACARADGVRCIAVTTGPYGADELSAADSVAAELTELEALLTQLR